MSTPTSDHTVADIPTVVIRAPTLRGSAHYNDSIPLRNQLEAIDTNIDFDRDNFPDTPLSQATTSFSPSSRVSSTTSLAALSVNQDTVPLGKYKNTSTTSGREAPVDEITLDCEDSDSGSENIELPYVTVSSALVHPEIQDGEDIPSSNGRPSGDNETTSAGAEPIRQGVPDLAEGCEELWTACGASKDAEAQHDTEASGAVLNMSGVALDAGASTESLGSQVTLKHEERHTRALVETKKDFKRVSGIVEDNTMEIEDGYQIYKHKRRQRKGKKSKSKARPSRSRSYPQPQSGPTDPNSSDTIFSGLDAGSSPSPSDSINSTSSLPRKPVDPNQTEFGRSIHTPEKPQPFIPVPSKAKAEWERQKKDDGAHNEVLDEIMDLKGLENVKDQFLAMYAKAQACEAQGITMQQERFHAVFQGNPGTGKTTVARLYARFLVSIGKLDSDLFYETSGAKIAYEDPKILDLKIRLMLQDNPKKKRKGGGVIFVDEAYQLTAPHALASGRQALDILLTEMENHMDKLVVIFVGYNKEMQSFYEHNPGLASRITYNMDFQDFEDWELWQMMRSRIQKRWQGRMRVEGGLEGIYMRVCIRRLGRQRGLRGFGNARAVATLLDKIAERQSQRMAEEKRQAKPEDELDYLVLMREDLIGPEPSHIWKSKSWEKLQKLVGLESVKKAAEQFFTTIETNYGREMEELKPLEFSLNRIFVGSPGTGKTTVAKIYGQIMADLGFLTNGEVVVKSAADFIGQCLGKSEAQTKAILDTTLGKVLIIDEAYMFYNSGADRQDQYRTAVIDTIVAEVQSVPGDNRCVLLLGYEDKMRDMFLNVNPGLGRRFQVDNPFRFEDYRLEQLLDILHYKLKEQDLTISKEGLETAKGILMRATMRPCFSNAGEVENLLVAGKLNCQDRMTNLPVPERVKGSVLQPSDLDPDYDKKGIDAQSCRNVLKGHVSDKIIKRLEEYQRMAKIASNESGFDPRELLMKNFIFSGNPGTGKTTVARKMGQIFYEMGLLSTREVIECSASDLVGQYVGQTAPKTKKQLERGLGKVLFIDEAYHLTNGQYSSEACDEFVYLLTNPKFRGKLIIILAGYPADMRNLMATRPALAGHFSEQIDFENIEPKECVEILQREIQQCLKGIGAQFLEGLVQTKFNQLLNLFKLVRVFPSWHNARDIKNLAQKIAVKILLAENVESSTQVNKDELYWNITYECIGRMVHEHRARYTPGVKLGDIWSDSSADEYKHKNKNTPAFPEIRGGGLTSSSGGSPSSSDDYNAGQIQQAPEVYVPPCTLMDAEITREPEPPQLQRPGQGSKKPSLGNFLTSIMTSKDAKSTPARNPAGKLRYPDPNLDDGSPGPSSTGSGGMHENLNEDLEQDHEVEIVKPPQAMIKGKGKGKATDGAAISAEPSTTVQPEINTETTRRWDTSQEPKYVYPEKPSVQDQSSPVPETEVNIARAIETLPVPEAGPSSAPSRVDVDVITESTTPEQAESSSIPDEVRQMLSSFEIEGQERELEHYANTRPKLRDRKRDKLPKFMKKAFRIRPSDACERGFGWVDRGNGRWQCEGGSHWSDVPR